MQFSFNILKIINLHETVSKINHDLGKRSVSSITGQTVSNTLSPFHILLLCDVTNSGEHLYCPEGHPVLKRYCELCLDLGDVTSFHAFYRDRNAIKCGACQYPVKIYRTVQLDQGVQLSSEELDLLKVPVLNSIPLKVIGNEKLKIIGKGHGYRKTSRERHKSAPRLRLKNSKRTLKCQSIHFHSTRKKPLVFLIIHSVTKYQKN